MRDCAIRCRSCGCIQHFDVETGAELTGEPWLLLRGQQALKRQGGCMAPCVCHDETRADNGNGPFEVRLGTPRALALPRRP